MGFLSYSQHGDDYIAWQLMKKKRKGVIVEVGAFDGIHLSNSYALEKMGWKSINIEPNPKIFKFLKQNRPKSKNYNCAVVGNSDVEEIVLFREEIGVLSGCRFDEADVKRRYDNRGIEYRAPEKIVVPARTLTSILETEIDLLGHFDVLSIDVEGFEIEVLKGLDFTRFQPLLLIIEANDKYYKTELLQFFTKLPNYLLVGENYQNLFFMEKSKISRKRLYNLELSNIQRAQQFHPIDDSLSLQSIVPCFKANRVPFSLVESIRSYFAGLLIR